MKTGERSRQMGTASPASPPHQEEEKPTEAKPDLAVGSSTGVVYETRPCMGTVLKGRRIVISSGVGRVSVSYKSVLCHPAGGNRRVRSGFKARFRAGGGFKPMSRVPETHVSHCVVTPNVQNEGIWQSKSEAAGARGGARDGRPRHSRIFPVTSD